MSAGRGTLVQIARRPVLTESRELLAQSWASLPARFQTPQQMFGRQGNPCGATIGTLPRCDFACRGCYLGAGANHVAPLPVEAIKAQMRTLRPTLGNSGNLQLTDGEVTLRPEAEIVELLRYAEEVGLIPMLMTHGDSFRRRPGLLQRLMVGGLREISIHVDTTMRGRKGAAYHAATTEAELNPLREEFAQMIREARRTTGLPLVAATTMTITRENLAGVPDAVRCVVHNADAFKMISFQPIAQVGRTEEGLGGGVGVEELWEQVARGLSGPAADPAHLWRARMWLGHHACNRYVHGFAVRNAAGMGEVVFHPMRLEGDPVDEGTVEEYLTRFGGASFRRDTPSERGVRLASIVLRAPRFWAFRFLPYAAHQLRRWDGAQPWRLLWRLLRGRVRADHFNIVSHHFMSGSQIETPEGTERAGLCVFKVPIGGRLVSMCEVNAMGVRDRFYEAIRAGHDPAAAALTPPGPTREEPVSVTPEPPAPRISA